MKRHTSVVVPFRSVRNALLRLPILASAHRPAAQVSVYPEFASVRPFARERWGELESFAPGTLIGYGFDLRRLAEKIGRGELQLHSVDHAIFALTDCGSRPVSDVLRVSLWQTFGVPVYELIVAPGCRLLAAECEAHDGWHLQEGISAYLLEGELVCDLPPLNNLRTGMTGEIETQPCECGRRTVRLKNLAPRLPRANGQRIAAIA